MISRMSYGVLLVVLLAVVAGPVAASETSAVNLPGWLGGLMALVAVLLPLLVWARLRSRGQL